MTSVMNWLKAEHRRNPLFIWIWASIYAFLVVILLVHILAGFIATAVFTLMFRRRYDKWRQANEPA